VTSPRRELGWGKFLLWVAIGVLLGVALAYLPRLL